MSNLRFGGQAAGLEGIDFLAAHGFDFADLNLNEIDKIKTRGAADAEGCTDARACSSSPTLPTSGSTNNDGMETHQ